MKATTGEERGSELGRGGCSSRGFFRSRRERAGSDLKVPAPTWLMGVLRAAASPFSEVGSPELGKEESRGWQGRHRLATCVRIQKASGAKHRRPLPPGSNLKRHWLFAALL